MHLIDPAEALLRPAKKRSCAVGVQKCLNGRIINRELMLLSELCQHAGMIGTASLKVSQTLVCSDLLSGREFF